MDKMNGLVSKNRLLNTVISCGFMKKYVLFIRIFRDFERNVVLLIVCTFGFFSCSENGSLSEAKELSSKFVTLLMKKTYPNTGSRPEYALNSWDYDSSTRAYTLNINAYWEGGCTVFSYKCEVAYSFLLEVTSEGEIRNYEITGMNNCAQEHVACDVAINVAKIIGNNIFHE